MARRDSRGKGKRGELELAAALRERGFPHARRGQQYKGTPGSPDVDVSEDDDRWHIESKRRERLHLYQAMEQAYSECGNKTPVVIHRSNRKPWVAIMWLDDWCDLACATAMDFDLVSQWRKRIEDLVDSPGDFDEYDPWLVERFEELAKEMLTEELKRETRTRTD